MSEGSLLSLLTKIKWMSGVTDGFRKEWFENGSQVSSLEIHQDGGRGTRRVRSSGLHVEFADTGYGQVGRGQRHLEDICICGSGIQGRCGLEVQIRDASLLPAQLCCPLYRITEDSAVTTFEALKARVRELERQLSRGDRYKCLICMVRGREPTGALGQASVPPRGWRGSPHCDLTSLEDGLASV